MASDIEANCGPVTSEKVTLVVFSGELDKAMAAFNIAIGAASSGMEVSMFFTFWGLNIIKKDKGENKPKDALRRMFSLVNRGGARRAHLSKFHMMGVGTRMMKRLMHQTRFPQLEELIVTAQEMDVKFIACTTSMAMMGISKESFVPGVNTFAGVATYLADARESKINLFI